MSDPLATEPILTGNAVAVAAELSAIMHAEGRAASERRSYTEGATLRIAANRIRAAFGLPLLDYDGTPLNRKRLTT
jgi:hypothetical protein